jgi:hypothetical protein
MMIMRWLEWRVTHVQTARQRGLTVVSLAQDEEPVYVTVEKEMVALFEEMEYRILGIQV